MSFKKMAKDDALPAHDQDQNQEGSICHAEALKFDLKDESLTSVRAHRHCKMPRKHNSSAG